MFVCYCLKPRTPDSTFAASERIDGARYCLLRYVERGDGPIYPQLVEEKTEDSFRFFAGRITGLSPSERLPDGHAVARVPAADWGFSTGEPDGSWIALKFDRRQDVLSAAADAWIMQRWFYHQRGDSWYVANSLRYLFRVLCGNCEINWEALPYLLQTEYLPLHHTPLKDVFQLDAGQVLTIREGVGSIETRGRIPVHRRPQTRKEEAVPAIAATLVETVRREVGDLERIMIPLSGGMDSRFLLGCALQSLPPEAITTFTFGHPNSLDLRIGGQLARVAGVRHIPLACDSRPLTVTLEDNFGTAEGMYSVLPDYPVSSFRESCPPGSYLLSGYIGDPVFGSKEKGAVFEESCDGKSEELHRQYSSANLVPWTVVRPLLSDAQPDPFGVVSAFDALPGATLQERLDFWYFGPHTLNRTHFAVTPGRDLAFYLTPFIQRRVLDLAFSLPPELRRKRRAYFAALAYRFPDLHALPSTNNFGFPTDRPAGLRIYAARLLRLTGARFDELLGPPLGRILYNHPRNKYNHPRTCYLPQHREHMTSCLEELSRVAAFDKRGLQVLLTRYRKNRPISVHLFRGLLTAHQWLRQYDRNRLKPLP